jgi:hypothetical protein
MGIQLTIYVEHCIKIEEWLSMSIKV